VGARPALRRTGIHAGVLHDASATAGAGLLAAAGTARFAPKRRAWRAACLAASHAACTSPQRGSAPERAAKAAGGATTERGGLRGSGQRPRRANGSEQEATTEPTGGTGRPVVAIPSLRGVGPLGGGWQRRALASICWFCTLWVNRHDHVVILLPFLRSLLKNHIKIA